jgi:hypothetical protein
MGVGAVGVEGFVARRDRCVGAAETVELVEGRRNNVGVGAVLVRWCLDCGDGGVSFTSLDSLRDCDCDCD